MPNPPLPTSLLTDGQQRRLMASLANVAAALREIEAVSTATTPPRDGVLHRMSLDLPPGFGRAIEGPLERARAHLAALADALGLPAIEASARREVQALVVSSLVILEDTDSRKLGAYGEVHPALPALLDPLLHRAHEEIRVIGDALARALGG
jgi:hypothetical protein